MKIIGLIDKLLLVALQIMNLKSIERESLRTKKKKTELLDK